MRTIDQLTTQVENKRSTFIGLRGIGKIETHAFRELLNDGEVQFDFKAEIWLSCTRLNHSATSGHIHGDHQALPRPEFVALLMESRPFCPLKSHVERRLKQANAWQMCLIRAKKSQALNRRRNRINSVREICALAYFLFEFLHGSRIVRSDKAHIGQFT